MIFRQQAPSPPLRGLVEYYWSHEGLVSAHTMERLLPDGAIELIVDLTDAPKTWAANAEPARLHTVHRSWISGQHSGPILIEAAKHSCMIGARFAPGGTSPISSETSIRCLECIPPSTWTPPASISITFRCVDRRRR